MALILGVVLVCGLPGAGKSTLIESFLHSDQHDDCVVVPTTTTTTTCVIEYDRVQAEQQQQEQSQSSASEVVVEESGSTLLSAIKTGDDELQAWRQTRRVALERLSQQIGALASASTATGAQEHCLESQHHLIFLDDNFYLRSMRKQVYQTCQAAQQQQQQSINGETRLEIRLGVVWLDTPLNVCLTRNSQRHQRQKVSNDVLRRMHARFEPPSPTSPLVLERQSFVRMVDTGGGSSCDGAPVSEQQQQPQLRDFIANLLRPDYSGAGRVLRPVVEDPETALAELQQQRATTRAATAADQFWRRCVTVTVQLLGPSRAAPANRVRRHCLAQSQQAQHDFTTGSCCCETEWLNLFLQGLGEKDYQDWLTREEKNVLRQALLPSNNGEFD